jgi:hypothetical protein
MKAVLLLVSERRHDSRACTTALLTSRQNTMRTILLSLLLLALWAAPAAAQDRAESLLSLAPGDSRVLLGLHVKKARDTAAFREVVSLARKDEFGKQVLNFFEADLGFNPEKQLHALAFALPVKNMRKGSQTFTMIAGGEFDPKRVDALLASRKDLKSRKEGNLTVLELGFDAEFALIDSKTAVFVVGSKKYRASAWKVARKKGSNVLKHEPTKALLALVKDAPHGWLIADTQELPQREDLQTQNTWSTFDLSKGFKMISRVTVGDEAQAKKVVADMEKSRIPSAMVLSSYGAQALANNLKTSSDGAIVILDTYMGEAEVRTSAGRIADMLRRERERLLKKAADDKAKAEAKAAETKPAQPAP